MPQSPVVVVSTVNRPIDQVREYLPQFLEAMAQDAQTGLLQLETEVTTPKPDTFQQNMLLGDDMEQIPMRYALSAIDTNSTRVVQTIHLPDDLADWAVAMQAEADIQTQDDFARTLETFIDNRGARLSIMDDVDLDL